MKLRHYDIVEKKEGRCPVTGKKATLIFGVGSTRKAEITVEREYQGAFIDYRVTMEGTQYTQDACLITFIGKRKGGQVVEMSLY